MAHLQIGSRVEVKDKSTLGTVAYIGQTLFSAGKWIGVVLDEPKGKNNGSVQGESYFQCKENHGTFVRQGQLLLIDESGNKLELSASPDKGMSRSTSGLRRLSSSRHSLAPKSTSVTPVTSRSREDLLTVSTVPSQPSESLLKRASFIESSNNAWTSLKSAQNLSKRSATTPTLKVMSRTRIPMTKSLTTPNKEATPSNKDQTGFVETLRPQFTAGHVLSSPGMQSQRPSQISIIDPVEHEGVKAQLQDVGEKLETMKIKHKEKMFEIDSLKLKLDQAAEFKMKIMEAQSSLKKELEKVKQEKQDAILANEDMCDITDALEMATLDKEMAEEKVETLQIELVEAKEKIEELTLDLEILKAEFDKIGASSAESDENSSVSSYQMKQLEQQNLRLRDTLVRMRDLSAHEKHESQKLQKDLEEKKDENAELHKTNERLQARIMELEDLVSELHEQVDAALGAEEMVEQLGLQKLSLEDKVKELEEAVADLEALQDINDQLQEDSRELELQLREEVDLAHAATREALREKENALEALADRELTIVKFRELVQNLRDQCQDLQTQLQKESSNNDAMKMSIPEMLDFKKMFAETKAQARAIDLELRRMEVQQSHQHIQYLIAYMPDSFMARGGDNDAVLTIMLITRLIWKSEVLLSQIKDKFPSIELSNKGELVKGHTAEQFASRCRLSFHIHQLQAILHQFEYGLNTCGTETLMRVGASYTDLSQQEKLLDSYIELLKTDQLDENVKTDHLEKSIAYFNTMHSLLLLSSGDTCLHQTNLLIDHTLAFNAACESIRTDTAIIQALIQTGDTSDMSPLCQHLFTVAEVMQQHIKQTRRRISATPDAITLPIPDLSGLLLKTSHCANKMTKALRDMAKTAFSQIALTTDEIYLAPSTLLEIASSSCDKVFEESGGQTAVACLKNSMNFFANEIANIAQAIQEAESYLPAPITDKQAKLIAPVILRAKHVKSELEQTKALQAKLESREIDVKELKMSIRVKQEEIGELIVRKDIAEKKLTDKVRNFEVEITKLKRKLEEADETMKRKEKQFEETMDHLQADIDLLENERGELKDKLKNYSKKVLIEGIAKTAAAANAGISSHGLMSPVSASGLVRESPLLVNEIKALRNALSHERVHRVKLEVNHYKNQLKKLQPLTAVKKAPNEESDNLNQLTKETLSLIKDVQSAYSLPKVIDISKRVPGTSPCLEKSSPINHIILETQRAKQLEERLHSLQTSLAKEMVNRKAGGKIETELAVFPTPEMKKAFEEDQPVVIGELTLPRNKDIDPKESVVSLTLNTRELHDLFAKLLPPVIF